MEKQAKFKEKYNLPFTLLSDPENGVAKRYGAFGNKMMYGRPVVGTIRSTYLIDEQGKVQARWSPVRVPGQVDKILATLGGEPATQPTKRKVTKKVAAKKPARAKAHPRKKARARA